VTDDPAAARQLAGDLFRVYDDIPAYRIILDREGLATVADAGLIGNEESCRAALAELADAGVTDFAAAVFGPSAEERERTLALLRDVRAADLPVPA
jgi:hypothetical protein